MCLYTCVRFTCVFCLVCLISLGMCYIRWRLCASWIHYQYIRDPGSQIRDPQSWLVNLGSMIQDPRSSILDRRPRVLYTPSRILDPGFRILDHASFILAQDSGSWIQFSESWIQDAGSRMQDQKSWIQHPGYWILDKFTRVLPENTDWLNSNTSIHWGFGGLGAKLIPGASTAHTSDVPHGPTGPPWAHLLGWEAYIILFILLCILLCPSVRSSRQRRKIPKSLRMPSLDRTSQKG